MGKIGDYIKIKHGYAFKGTSITNVDNGVVLVTPGNFAIGGGFKEDKCKYYCDTDYPNEYVLKHDDLIVTMTDLSKEMDTLGYSALVPCSGRKYLHNQRIGLVQLISDKVDKHYMYWFMRSKYYQNSVVSSASGSVIHHTSPERICNIEFNPPQIVTQRKVSGFLDIIQDKIELNYKINKNLDA